MNPYFVCTVRRPAPLSTAERDAIRKVVAKYSVESRIKRFQETGQGIHWRPWQFLPPEEFSADDTLLESRAELPSETDEALKLAIEHWSNAASALRREIHKALWEVGVERADEH